MNQAVPTQRLETRTYRDCAEYLKKADAKQRRVLKLYEIEFDLLKKEVVEQLHRQLLSRT